MAASLVNASSNKRIKLDREVGLGDYTNMIDAICVEVGTRDIWGATKKLRADTWSSSPTLQKLLDSIPIISSVIDAVPNGLLSHPLFVKAVKMEHAKRALVFADKPLTVALAEMSKGVRVSLSKWREIRKGGEAKRVVLLSVSTEETDQIADVLFKIDLAWGGHRYERGMKPGDLSPPKSWMEPLAMATTALVPWHPPAMGPVVAPTPELEMDSSGVFVPPIFDMSELALSEDDEVAPIVAFAPPQKANTKQQLGVRYNDDLKAALDCESATAKHNGIINHCKQHKRMMKEVAAIAKEMDRAPAPVATPNGKKKKEILTPTKDSAKKTSKNKKKRCNPYEAFGEDCNP